MKMTQGWVVKDYDPSYTHCSFCGRELVWGERSNGFSSFTGKSLPVTKIRGCPMYGKVIGDWHDFWWEDNLFDIIREDMIENENISS